MMTPVLKNGLLISSILMILGCTKNPKVIEAATSSETQSESGTGIFSSPKTIPIPSPSETGIGNDVHTVKALEVLPTSRYVYVKVNEGNEDFWIATGLREVQVGAFYFYRDGLLKTNFESVEHKRVFDKLYLVSSLVEADHGSTTTKVVNPSNTETNVNVLPKAENKGSVKISALVANPTNYEGKRIQITGTCVKVNANIMGRNWIHLKDGSKDDYDLVVTANVQIPVGETVTITGTVVLDKDFGSGYHYDILLEEGVID